MDLGEDILLKLSIPTQEVSSLILQVRSVQVQSLEHKLKSCVTKL